MNLQFNTITHKNADVTIENLLSNCLAIHTKVEKKKEAETLPAWECISHNKVPQKNSFKH